MAKITDPDLLNVGGELFLDTSARTIQLAASGNLVAKDGVTLQALYSKLILLWETATYNKYPFPMYVIDAKSGQYQFGSDGGSYNGWKPLDDTTRTYLRDGGWSEYSNAGVLNRQYVGIVSLGTVNTGAQLYYQRTQTGSALTFTFTDAVNEGIQVYGDASNGNFDNRTYFKGFVREAGYKYDDSILGDTGQTGTGAYTVNMLLSNESDLKIQASDATVASGAIYTGITVTYYESNQNRTIGGVSYPFRVIIAGNGATAEQIYTKIQYLLRQNTDVDAGSGSVIGKTASLLLNFVGDTLYTTQGVYIDNYDSNDTNRLVFTDQNSVARTEPYVAAGTLNFNSFLTSGGSGYYRAYFTSVASGDYGTANAVTVNDKDGNPVAGTITAAEISFTFAYDSNTQGGRTAGTDAPITVVAGNRGVAKPVVTTYTITRAVGQGISLVAEQDRAYSNP